MVKDNVKNSVANGVSSQEIDALFKAGQDHKKFLWALIKFPLRIVFLLLIFLLIIFVCGNELSKKGVIDPFYREVVIDKGRDLFMMVGIDSNDITVASECDEAMLQLQDIPDEILEMDLLQSQNFDISISSLNEVSRESLSEVYVSMRDASVSSCSKIEFSIKCESAESADVFLEFIVFSRGSEHLQRYVMETNRWIDLCFSIADFAEEDEINIISAFGVRVMDFEGIYDSRLSVKDLRLISE